MQSKSKSPQKKHRIDIDIDIDTDIDVRKSLPGLLHRREIGSIRNPYSICRTTKSKENHNHNHNHHHHHHHTLDLLRANGAGPKHKHKHQIQWREFFQRRIPFSMLQTPVTDAVLGMDRSGSHLIAIGDGRSPCPCPWPSSLARVVGGEEDEEDGTNSDHQQGFGLIPSLSLRFYATPSPAALVQAQMQKRCRRNRNRNMNEASPLIYSIPLLFETCSRDQDDSDEINNSATTPVQILMSSDGMIGVALIHHSKRDEDVSGSIAIFPLPNNRNPPRAEAEQAAVKMCRIPRTTISGIHAHTLRNLLWTTSILPLTLTLTSLQDVKARSESEAPLLCHEFRETNCGYMFWNDEEDGFRIFWMNLEVLPQTQSQAAAAADYDCVVSDSPCSRSRQKIQPKRNDIVTIVSDSSIEMEWAQTFTGCATRGGSSTTSSTRSEGLGAAVFAFQELDVILEGYLKISALLSDILDRRRKLVCSIGSSSSSNADHSNSLHVQLPDYFYNLVSITEGRSATLVVVFDNPQFRQVKHKHEQKKVPAAYGVLLKLDIFDHSYTEMKWLQHPSRNGAEFLRRWSNNLASIHRMAEMNVGPHCVPSSTSKETILGIKTHECDFNDYDDMNVELWKPFVNQDQERTGGKKKLPPKLVAMSSLYPTCDIINNNAVTSGVPVHSISCRDFPLELSYS